MSAENEVRIERDSLGEVQVRALGLEKARTTFRNGQVDTLGQLSEHKARQGFRFCPKGSPNIGLRLQQ